MRRRRVAGGLALAACLALAGCATGSPQSGVVATVSTNAGSGLPAEPPVAAEPPDAGLDPVAVARGFMQAMSSMDAAVAQSWVSDTPAALDAVRTWSSGGEVHVYDRFDVLGTAPASGSRDEVEVRLAARQEGTLTGDTWRRVAGTEEIHLTLRRRGGEWRVANPPDSPWITHADFGDAYQRATLYFAAPDGQHLAPRPVFFRTPRRPIPNTETDLPSRWEESAAVQATLDRLLRGPTEGDGALTTAIPPGTTAHVEPGEDALRIGLSPGFADDGGESGQLRVAQIVWTASTVVETLGVELTVDGEPPAEVGPDGFDARGQWRSTTPPLDRLLPERGGREDKVVFIRGGAVHTVQLDGGESALAPLPFTPSPDGSYHAPSWSPRGDRVAFLADEATTGRGGNADQAVATRRLYVGPAAGGEARATSLVGALSEPSWTPDGSELLAFRHDGPETSLWAVNASTGATRRLTMPDLPADGLAPATIRVSPTGASALVLATDDPTNPGRGGDLFTGPLTADGITGWTPLAIQPGLRTVRSPVWLEPGVIGFVANSGSLGDRGSLWTVQADGWELDQVEFGAEHPGELAGEMSASSDGDLLVFTVRTGVSTSQIFAIRRHGENVLPQPLTGPGTYESDADPSLGSP
jgi:hypothetical protein